MNNRPFSMRERWARAVRAFREAWVGERRSLAPPEGVLRLPGAGLDYERLAGDVLQNSAVAICLGWIADNITQPELRVVRGERDGVPDPVWDHPLTRLAARPNPFYDGDALWAATAISYAAHGNAYWIKVRSETGRVAELWWAPHWSMTPCGDAEAFIRHYRYRAGGRDHFLPVEDVVHFRYGIDPREPRLGMSRLRPLLREIVTDNEAAGFMAGLLRNMGVPGLVLSPGEKEDFLSSEQAAELQRRVRELRGERAGESLVVSTAIRVQPLAMSPEQLTLEKLRWTPEARICGALRLPALVVGLNVGDLTRTYANYRQARRSAYEDCILPMGRRFAATLEHSLLPELGDARHENLRWDTSGVAALREDQTELYRRLGMAVSAGWMRVDEARSLAGLAAEEDSAAGGRVRTWR